MILPETIKVGPHVYKVRVMEFTDDSYGDENMNTQEIRINANLSESQRITTFIHEVLGICNATMHGDQVMHALLESLSQQLAQVLIDNQLLRE